MGWAEVCKRFTFNEHNHMNAYNFAHEWLSQQHISAMAKLISLIELTKQINDYHVNDPIPMKIHSNDNKYFAVIIRIWIEWKHLFGSAIWTHAFVVVGHRQLTTIIKSTIESSVKHLCVFA